MKRIIALIAVFVCVSSYAQQMSDTLRIYFRQGHSSFESNYRDNGTRVRAFADNINRFKSQSSAFDILSVRYQAGTSPEGSMAINQKLADKRSSNLTALLRRYLTFPDSIIHISTVVEDWSGLAELMRGSSTYSSDSEVLSIITDASTSSEDKKKSLQQLGGGKIWNQLNRDLFPELRAFNVYIEVGIRNPDLGIPVIDDPTIVTEDEQTPVLDDNLSVEKLAFKEEVPEEEPEWTRKLYIKTNSIGWAMFISNVAVEIDITRNLSFQLPIYYSAVNYFHRDLKFRTFAVQPELRWWFNKPEGLFVGAHFGTAYFNYATKGDWRIQTYDGDRPLWGGGLAAGYRMPLSKRHPRWNIEFSLGAGVYDVYYDKFYNETNGPKATNGHTTFVGIDHAAVSFSYSFDLKKRRAR